MSGVNAQPAASWTKLASHDVDASQDLVENLRPLYV